MKRQGFILIALFAGGVAVMLAGFRDESPAQEKAAIPAAPAAPAAAQPAKADGAEAGIKVAAAEYQKAFNAGDAKAAAALWTVEGEYIADDGEVVSGRDAIEKSLAEVFKAHPKATAEVRVESVRVLGRGLASAEGTVIIKHAGNGEPIESQYTALHVNEDGVWRAASVSEWVPDPATNVTPKNLEWMIGEWSAKGEGGEVKITYAWDDTKTFINGKYTVTKDGKTVSSGTQVIARNPAGGLRSWMFDSSGTFGESIWVRDEKRWISETSAMLPNGTEIASVNVVIPLGPDAFTWQTTDRTINDVPLPALPPVKVTRVKK